MAQEPSNALALAKERFRRSVEAAARGEEVSEILRNSPAFKAALRELKK
jgi:hypothetical protein